MSSDQTKPSRPTIATGIPPRLKGKKALPNTAIDPHKRGSTGGSEQSSGSSGSEKTNSPQTPFDTAFPSSIRNDTDKTNQPIVIEAGEVQQENNESAVLLDKSGTDVSALKEHQHMYLLDASVSTSSGEDERSRSELPLVTEDETGIIPRAYQSSLVSASSSPRTDKGIVDASRYLINLDSKDSRGEWTKLEKLPPAVKTYLRLLGRNAKMEALQGQVKAPNFQQAELAGGWLVLKRASQSSTSGIFFYPSKITPEAVQQWPHMPWMHKLHPNDIYEHLIAGVTVEEVEEARGEPYVETFFLSPYLQASRRCVISNAIVSLPERGIDHDHPSWELLVELCYSQYHPVRLLDSHPNITDDDNEGLILAIRDESLPWCVYKDRNRHQGLFPDRDAAYEGYYSRDCGI